MIFTDNDSYFDVIQDMINQNPHSVFISSFGLYAGITTNSTIITKYQNKPRDILNILRDRNINTFIMIGVQKFFQCKENCDDCKKKFVNDMIRLLCHVENWPMFKWKFLYGNHLKCFLSMYDDDFVDGVSGGRNFSNSDWLDVSLSLSGDEANELSVMFLENWKTAFDINEYNINKFINDNGVIANPEWFE